MSQHIDYIFLNGRKISFEQIREKSIEHLSSYEQKVIDFYTQWLCEQSSFELSTSGSTGVPKKITLSRIQLIESATQTINFLNLKPGETMLTCLNCQYIAGIMMLVRGLVGEMENHVVTPSSSPLENFHYKIDFTALVPLQLQEILHHSKEHITKIKKIIIGGAPIPKTLEEIIHLLPEEITCYQTFGMTETVSHFAMRNISKKENHYTTLSDVQIDISDENCLMVWTPVTKKWIQTNDIVELCDQNTFKWLGRKDHVINSGGIKLFPESIESEISSFFQENRFIISSEPHPILGEQLILILEKDLDRTQLKELIFSLKKNLPKYWKPKKIYATHDAFEETSSGKLDRINTLKLNKKVLYIID